MLIMNLDPKASWEFSWVPISWWPHPPTCKSVSLKIKNALICDDFSSTAYQNDTKVYSGNFLDSSARQTHTVKNVTTNGIVSLLQICPSVAWMVNEPVTFNFDYVEPLFENITAEVIYFDRTAMVSC